MPLPLWSMCIQPPTVLIPLHIPSASCLHFCPRRVMNDTSFWKSTILPRVPALTYISADLCNADTWTGRWWVAGDRAELFLLFPDFKKHFRAMLRVGRAHSVLSLFYFLPVLFVWDTTSSSLGVACLWGELWVASDFSCLFSVCFVCFRHDFLIIGCGLSVRWAVSSLGQTTNWARYTDGSTVTSRWALIKPSPLH